MNSSPAHEYCVLMGQYAKAQLRCSELVASQAQEIEALRAETIRLRAAVLVRDTALAFAREDRAAFEAAIPGLPRRRALARHVDFLKAQVQALMRELLQWQWRAASRPAGTETLPAHDARRHPGAVLCIAQDDMGKIVTRHMVEQRRPPGPVQEPPTDEAGLEASLTAADLVICQTGCVSHNAYWRVQDHCKRTGKPCVLVDQPQAMLWLRQGELPWAARLSESVPGDP